MHIYSYRYMHSINKIDELKSLYRQSLHDTICGANDIQP